MNRFAACSNLLRLDSFEIGETVDEIHRIQTMGQNFRAILKHNLREADLRELPLRLDAVTNALSQHLKATKLDSVSYPSRPSRWKWDWNSSDEPDLERWRKGEPLSLSGVASLSLDFGGQCLALGCWIRWREFVTDKVVQQSMRAVTLQFAKLFESELAIYIPDSSSIPAEQALNLVSEASIADVLRSLEQQQGAAAISIESICRPRSSLIDGKSYETLECEGYYVDRFEDAHADETA
jgi:hypothetical protein